jgi:hypothetical protein
MAKSKLKTHDEPIGTNLYIVGVVESVAKNKTVLVNADEFTLDDHSNLVFINDGDEGQDFIYAIRAGDWKTVTKFEEKVEEHARCVRVMTLQERLDEKKALKELRDEEERKEREAAEKAAEEEKTAAEKLKESINQLSHVLGKSAANKPKPIAHNTGNNTAITLVSMLPSKTIPKPNQKEQVTKTTNNINPKYLDSIGKLK